MITWIPYIQHTLVVQRLEQGKIIKNLVRMVNNNLWRMFLLYCSQKNGNLNTLFGSLSAVTYWETKQAPSGPRFDAVAMVSDNRVSCFDTVHKKIESENLVTFFYCYYLITMCLSLETSLIEKNNPLCHCKQYLQCSLSLELVL